MVEFGALIPGPETFGRAALVSGKICTATAFWVPSGSGIAVTPI